MLMPVEYRQFVVKTRPRRDAKAARRPRVRESLDTLILGALSTAIGVVLLVALASGVARRPIAGWNEKAISQSAHYYIPSRDCVLGALVGEALGVAGLLLGRFRHNTIPPLSALGTAVSMLHVYLFFLHVSVMEFL